MIENEVIDSENRQGIINDSEVKTNLTETAKWAKFLAILGFIGIAFMVIGALFAGAFLGSQPGMGAADFPFTPGMISIIYLLIAVLYFFPIYYLYNFSVKMKNALLSGNDSLLKEAFGHLKSHYKFIGIFTIVFIALYFLAIIIGIFVAATYR